MKVKVNLDTLSEVSQFVAIATAIKSPVYLSCGDFKVSAKSLLGAVYTMEWSEIWCECADDIYTAISRFVAD